MFISNTVYCNMIANIVIVSAFINSVFKLLILTPKDIIVSMVCEKHK